MAIAVHRHLLRIGVDDLCCAVEADRVAVSDEGRVACASEEVVIGNVAIDAPDAHAVELGGNRRLGEGSEDFTRPSLSPGRLIEHKERDNQHLWVRREDEAPREDKQEEGTV